MVVAVIRVCSFVPVLSCPIVLHWMVVLALETIGNKNVGISQRWSSDPVTVWERLPQPVGGLEGCRRLLVAVGVKNDMHLLLFNTSTGGTGRCAWSFFGGNYK